MPGAKRRKIAPTSEEQETAPENVVTASGSSGPADLQKAGESTGAEMPECSPSEPFAVDKNKERQERFKALQARAVSQHYSQARCRKY